MVAKEFENKSKTRKVYIAPHIEIIYMAVENSIMINSGTGSGKVPGYTEGGDMFGRNSTRSGSSYSSGTASDIEDMINDILTIEQ